MKKCLILLVALFFSGLSMLEAQITAGEVPVGMNVLNPNIELEVVYDYIAAFDSIDLDLDNDFDIVFRLSEESNNNNYVEITTRNAFELITMDHISSLGAVYLFDYGDMMVYPAHYQWGPEGAFNVGFFTTGTFYTNVCLVNDKYIAYRKADSTGESHQYGWIKVSFSIDDSYALNVPITMTVYEYLPVSGTNDIRKLSNKELKIYPNPTNNIISIEKQGIKKIELLDIKGKVVFSKEVNVDKYILDMTDFSKTAYFIRIITEFGVNIQKIILK